VCNRGRVGIDDLRLQIDDCKTKKKLNRKGAKVAKELFFCFVVAIEMQAFEFVLRTILRRRLGAGCSVLVKDSVFSGNNRYLILCVINGRRWFIKFFLCYFIERTALPPQLR